jgi:glutamate--cysteine ligase
MFANSPLIEGRRSELLCERGATWLAMDPDRSGILPFAWERDMSFRRYVEWALDVPMFLIKRGERLISNTGQSFRAFLAEGSGNVRATRADWETHLNSLFPEARLKRTLEVRGVDAQPNDLVCAVPALWKGVLYDEQALAQAESLIAPLSATLVDAVRPEIVRHALKARLLDKPVLRWAQELFEIARGGLSRLAVCNRNGDDETIHLAHLQQLLEAGKTPAELWLEAIAGADDFKAAAVAHARV